MSQSVATCLTEQQREACRLRVFDALTQQQVADAVGVSRRTLTRWEQTPAWEDYVREIQEEMHAAIVGDHKRAAKLGAALRLRWLRQVERLVSEAEASDRPADVLSTAVLKDVGNMLDRLATSAEDRAGYPRTERRESTATVAVTGLDLGQLAAMTPEQLRALAGADDAPPAPDDADEE